VQIALFVTCVGDTMSPEAGRATAAVLERLGHQVVFPAEQTCCGQLHVNSGTGALSPGDIANATIGRAMGLIVKNLGGARKGMEDMGVLGNPGKYTMALAENEEASPDGWEPLHVQQRKQIEAYREAWKEAGHRREPRVSVSRSIFAIVDDRDREYFGRDARDQDQIGYIDANTRAVFGRSYAAEPDVLVKDLAADEAIAAADTLLGQLSFFAQPERPGP